VLHFKKSGKPSPVTSTIRDCKSWINTGAGWRRNDAYKPKTIINGKGVRILDVNGNGLVDYLQCDAACNLLLCYILRNQASHRRLHQQYINTGTGWKRDDAYKPQTAIAGNYSGVVKDYGVRIVDVNGDGLVDYLQCDTAGACKAWINTGSGWQRNDSCPCINP
jgi:hypothetical protein